MPITALRALQVLETMAGMRQPVSLVDLADRTGLSVTQAFRSLQALEQERYVDHQPRRGYRLGSRAIALATLIGPRPELVRALAPIAARLASASGESVVVHLRSGSERVLVLGLPGPQEPRGRQIVVLGERAPLSAGCSGRVILANLPTAEIETHRGDVADRTIEAIRRRGYDMSFGENHRGVNGIAAAIVGEDGYALGSLSIAGPATRLRRADMVRQADALIAACHEASPRVAQLIGPGSTAVLRALDLGLSQAPDTKINSRQAGIPLTRHTVGDTVWFHPVARAQETQEAQEAQWSTTVATAKDKAATIKTETGMYCIKKQAPTVVMARGLRSGTARGTAPSFARRSR